ncbi:MAG: hypothetical protein ACKOFG_16810 [Limnohabitans sp.]
MTAPALIRRTTLPAALGSLVSLAAQATMALFLLGLFEPQAVGVFSVIAQIAFGWAMLALAQGHVSLLANQHMPAAPAARKTWRNSLNRWAWLTPAAALAAWWASRTGAPPASDITSWASSLAWAGAIALLQMGWLLAHSLTLRMNSPMAIGAVRMLPPVLAAALAGVGALALDWRHSNTLTSAALMGYAAGALWLLPALRGPHATDPLAPAPLPAAAGDGRSERLKFIHTFSDVLVATALAAHWASVYGAAQAGCLLVLLRVMGFIPALLGTAWAQVLLSRPLVPRPSSALAALAGVLSVATLALLIGLALHKGWLAGPWSALQDYLWPLALWQMAASVMAAASHRPFMHGQAARYTRQCLAMNAVQALLLLLPPWLDWPLQTHLWALAGFWGVALTLQALWAAQLEPADTGDRR